MDEAKQHSLVSGMTKQQYQNEQGISCLYVPTCSRQSKKTRRQIKLCQMKSQQPSNRQPERDQRSHTWSAVIVPICKAMRREANVTQAMSHHLTLIPTSTSTSTPIPARPPS
jgi:hypothetical protein